MACNNIVQIIVEKIGYRVDTLSTGLHIWEVHLCDRQVRDECQHRTRTKYRTMELHDAESIQNRVESETDGSRHVAFGRDPNSKREQ